MENQPRRRFTLPLHALFVVCKYLGAAAVCLGYPGLASTCPLWIRGPLVSRPWIMLWPLILLSVGLTLDRSWLLALQRDMADHGLHVKTLEALAAPLLFIFDILAILTALAGQAQNPENDLPIRLHTAAMAAGIILFIYGRLMPRIPYDSPWGIRTEAAKKDVRAWGIVHLRAMPGVCACGALALLAGTFLPPLPAAACASLCLIAAFAIMFTRRA